MGRAVLQFAIVLLCFCASTAGFAAAATEKGAYQAAAQAFQDRNYPRAEAEFAAFVNQFTNSAQVPEAILFQAEARIEQANYDGAIELLKTRLPQAGAWSDHYLFWLGEASLRKGDYPQAGEYFSTLIKQHPASSRRLEAALSETMARARLNQWQRVIELLQDTNGVFQVAARANATNELALRGYLLLSEAQLSQGNYAAAQAALQPIASLPLQPRLAWQRQYLTTRVHFDQWQLEPARATATNLLDLAAKSNEKPLLAESHAIYAGLLERLGQADEAISLYERNLADGFPAERQRHALFKIAELSLAQKNVGRAAEVLDRFTAQHKEAPFRDLGLLTLGELRLRQHLADPRTNAPAAAPPSTNAPVSTNVLDRAVAAFSTLITNYPQSQFIGRAHLNLGWCHWLRANMPDAISAFRTASEKLPPSHDQAVAFYKLADAQFRSSDAASAITNYSLVATRYDAMPETRTNLIEPALYQLARAGLGANQLDVVTNALRRIMSEFPTNYFTERAVLVSGQSLSRSGNPAGARQIFSEFAQKAPKSDLAAEVRLGIARTYERENNWAQAVAEYESWLATFTNAPAGLPRATYSLAWANLRASREPQAFQQFTNFLARFPGDDLAPLAQWWVADYHYRNGRHVQAEENYQLLYNNPKVAGTEIAYQARLMAGRSAFQRSGWQDARTYFTNLTSDYIKCPPDIWAQAAFAYANVLMNHSTNKLADYAEAVNVFNLIYGRFPTNEVAVLALGEKASCLLQWAQTLPQYEAAAAEFHKVLTNQLASPTARAVARVGLGVVLERQAAQKTGANQAAILRQAQNLYLEVFYYSKDLREHEKPDLFWVKKAGLEATRLAETLGDWTQAIGIYERLSQLLPALRPSLEKKVVRARENIARTP